MSDLTASPGAGGETTVQVWDPFVRLFHWSLAGLVLVAFLTGDESEKLHITVGYAIVALIVARLVWGVIGPKHARFGDFMKSPSEILNYAQQELRGKAPRYLGHNPLGGAMVLGLLLMLLVVCGLGYQLTTDAYWGDEEKGELHEAVAYLLLGMVGLHVLGALWTGMTHRENLIKAMITGRKSA